MSIQVSYKKQFTFFILLTLIFLVVVEVFVIIWLNFVYTCDFEDSEIFEDVDYETKRKLCLDNIYFSQVYGDGPGVRGTTGSDSFLVQFNSEGLRGPEFTIIKPDNTLRIITVGGSTTFGSGVLDHQTFPTYLQSFYDDLNLDINFEVINAGQGGSWSFREVSLIHEKLLAYDPDLFIVFDGWNDIKQENMRNNPNASPILWKERWLEICELGNQIGFDTLITIQPAVSTGKQVLTAHEFVFKTKIEDEKVLQNYPAYVEQLEELAKDCSQTADLRGIFDDTQVPIFFNKVHVGPKGNQIIAKNLFQLSVPIVKERIEYMSLNNDSKRLIIEEIDTKMVSNNDDIFFEEVDNLLKKILYHYHTPKIASIIFHD